MPNLVTYRRTTGNPQHQNKVFGATSISGSSLKDENGITKFVTFKDEEGEASDLVIPEGGELEVDISDPIHLYNYETYKKLKAAGKLPIELGLIVEERGATISIQKKRRELWNEVYDILSELESNQEEYVGLAIRLGFNSSQTAEFDEVIEYVNAEGESNPQRVLNEINNPDKELIFLLYKAKAEGVVDQKGSEYYFKNNALGYNDASAVSILKANADILNGIKSELNRLKPAQMVSRKEPEFFDDENEKDDLLKEEARLNELKQNSSGTEVDAKEAFDIGIKNEAIQYMSPGRGKSKIFLFNGQEVGATEADVLEFLDKSPSVKASLYAMK